MNWLWKVTLHRSRMHYPTQTSCYEVNDTPIKNGIVTDEDRYHSLSRHRIRIIYFKPEERNRANWCLDVIDKFAHWAWNTLHLGPEFITRFVPEDGRVYTKHRKMSAQTMLIRFVIGCAITKILISTQTILAIINKTIN